MLNNINLFEQRWKKCVHFIDCSMDGWMTKVLLNKKKMCHSRLCGNEIVKKYK